MLCKKSLLAWPTAVLRHTHVSHSLIANRRTYERTCQYKLSSRYFVGLVGVAVTSSLTPWRGSVAYCWACRLNWITRTSPRTSCTYGRMLPTIGSRQSDVFYVTSALGSAVTAYGLGRSECGSRRMYVHVHVSIAPWQIMQGCVLFACSGWCWRYEKGNDLRWRRRATTRYAPATWRHHAQ